MAARQMVRMPLAVAWVRGTIAYWMATGAFQRHVLQDTSDEWELSDIVPGQETKSHSQG
jgi:hypothetical protein